MAGVNNFFREKFELKKICLLMGEYSTQSKRMNVDIHPQRKYFSFAFNKAFNCQNVETIK